MEANRYIKKPHEGLRVNLPPCRWRGHSSIRPQNKVEARGDDGAGAPRIAGRLRAEQDLIIEDDGKGREC